MNAKLIGYAATLLLLAGCGDRMGDYPALMPTDQLLAEPTLPEHAQDAATDPTATDAALQGRAAGLSGRSGATPANSADLKRRADALRARASALAKTSLDECPEGDTSCTPPQDGATE
ncbi:hypothetical protein [Paracoccus laeviglucosivorans]|uniref:Uncharacterized protein n=1 Tax=Paracoccus laeviglucosivorans TaxID=1197861 RepID=A0A521C812_9RHOB|nr:hypothetical protein [Paracoccus laeviglucosivorans]SMO54850.1 hypothetical protein SAMN06265221_10414 [Paracoccus laeviglucosivorans]